MDIKPKQQPTRRQVLDWSGAEFDYVNIDGCQHICMVLELFGFCTIRHDGREPLTAQEVIAQATLLDIELLPIEAKMILDLSQAFIGAYSEYDEEPMALNPYDPNPVELDEDEEEDEPESNT